MYNVLEHKWDHSRHMNRGRVEWERMIKRKSNFLCNDLLLLLEEDKANIANV